MNIDPDPIGKQRIALKVHRIGLAAQAVAAKREEKKLRTTNPYRAQLHNIRVGAARQDNRAANLAYAFIRGKPLRRTENNVLLEATYPTNHKKLGNWSRPKWDEVWDYVLEYTDHLPVHMVKRAFYDWLLMANLPSSVAPKMVYDFDQQIGMFEDC